MSEFVNWRVDVPVLNGKIFHIKEVGDGPYLAVSAGDKEIAEQIVREHNSFPLLVEALELTEAIPEYYQDEVPKWIWEKYEAEYWNYCVNGDGLMDDELNQHGEDAHFWKWLDKKAKELVKSAIAVAKGEEK